MAKITVDNSAEMFGAATSIADLARFSFESFDSDAVSIYFLDGILDTDWKWETARMEYEYATGLSAWFKDGSAIHVGAWRTSEDESGRFERREYRAGVNAARRRMGLAPVTVC